MSPKELNLTQTLEKRELQITLLEEELREANNALEIEQNQCAALQSDIEHLIDVINSSSSEYTPNPHPPLGVPSSINTQ